MRLHRDPIRGGTRTKRAVAMLLLTKPKTELRYSYSFTCYSVRRGKRGKRGPQAVPSVAPRLLPPRISLSL